MTAEGARPERVPAGGVGKPHGLDGSFYVTQPVPALLKRGARIFVEGEDEPREIDRRAGTDERPILRLSGAAGRESAEALRGKRLAIPGEDAPALDKDEYWAHELVGCDVLAQHAGGSLGEVVELQGLPSCDVIRVTGSSHGELWIPLVRDAIIEVDLEQRQITVDDEFLALDA